MEDQVVNLVQCPRCGQLKEAHPTDKHLCVDCAHAENNRLTYYRQHQGDWIAEAKEQGIEVWLQQPGETQWEYTVWVAFRDSYPGKKPKYADVARQLGTTYSVVQHIAQRWSFPARMQIWMGECDRITMLQRKDEILGMNQKHISMAEKLMSKLDEAIDKIQPVGLKPTEIASLAKLATEMERKARIDTASQEEIRRAMVVDSTNPELKKGQTKQSDLTEIVEILLKTGALGSITTIGLKETTTREFIASGETGNIIQMEEDD